MTVSRTSRYHGVETVEADGRIFLAHRRPPAAVVFPDALLHTVVGGETPDGLAYRYYGREELWWRIADANPDLFPLDWKAGDVLVIPPIRVATRTPRR